MSKSSESYNIDRVVWEDILRLSSEELADIRKLSGEFQDNLCRIAMKEFVEKYPNQNGVYTLDGIDSGFLNKISNYYGDVTIKRLLPMLVERGFTLPSIDVRTSSRRLFYIVIDVQTFNNISSAEDLLDYIDEFLYNNIPHVPYTPSETEVEEKEARIRKLCKDTDEDLEFLLKFDSRFGPNELPRLVSDITVAGSDVVTKERFDLVRRALCLYYTLFYDSKPYGSGSLIIGGDIYDFSYLGLPVVDEIVYDINVFKVEANKCIPFCAGISDYNYVDFTKDDLTGLIDMSKLRVEGSNYSLPYDRLKLFHRVWDEVLEIKRDGRVPILCFSEEMNSLEKLITVSMVILEDVRVGIRPRGDIGRFLAEYSRVAQYCNSFAEDRLRFMVDSVDAFFSLSNRELWFGAKLPNQTTEMKGAFYHTAPISIGYVEITEDKAIGGYRIISDKEKTINFDLINDDKITIVPYKELNFVTLEDTFAGMPGKEGRSFSITEKSNLVLCKLFEQYEKLIKGVTYDSPFEKSLRSDEFLSLRNCFFMIYEGKFCVARIMEVQNKLSVVRSRFIYWAQYYAEEISYEELESRQFVEKDITEEDLYRTCLPLTMLADYDGIGSSTEVEYPNGEVEELRLRIKPYVNTDGITGCLMFMYNTGRYTQQVQDSLKYCRKIGLDAVAMGKFDMNSNFIYKTEPDGGLFKLLTREQLRRMGYLTCYGGDNLVWKDGYEIKTDTFKREKE